jgi:TM2 domain-containing membrane protein YozV
VSLGLNDNPTMGALAPELRHKSAGRAFALSLLVPGLGQLYCGKTASGGLTLAVWLLGLGLCIAHVSLELTGQALIVMLVLWIFSFLDAYFTAIEVNQGQDDLVEGQNPRVAVTLNLLTAGFGYFYLGQRAKGIILFVVMQVARLAMPPKFALVLVLVQLLAAVDAYRIARREVKEALESATAQQVDGAAPVLQLPASPAPGSRLPVQVPVVLACLLGAGFVLLVVIGLVAGRWTKHPAAASVHSPAGRMREPSKSPYSPRNNTPIHAVDLTTAVQDVQRVQRKWVRGKDDLPYLKQDAAMLSKVLGAPKPNSADAMVAHYYRALALAMNNMALEHEGEPMDLAGARMARADLDKILGAGRIVTYVPEVNVTSAEYWAGIVTRNQLHNEPAAYSYWEKCASNAHAGCLHNLAGARVTGEGGEKVDVHEALDLYTSVYDSGIKFHCAGAYSAGDIALINYFTGVRRSGDDEIEWVKKAEGLLDTLEAVENNRNVCHRAGLEVDEFLFQLSRGQRDDTILQDAVSRLDEDSAPTQAVIQFISGAIDESGFDAAVKAAKSPGARCSAYFDAMWYAELRNETAIARRFDQQLADIGKFHCGQHLVYASKYKF